MVMPISESYQELIDMAPLEMRLRGLRLQQRLKGLPAELLLEDVPLEVIEAYLRKVKKKQRERKS